MKRRSNSGQATIEFALVMPLFVFSVLLMFAVLSACLNVLALNDLARSAARVAITAHQPEDAVRKMLQQSTIDSSVIERPNGIITVSVSRPFRFWLVDVPVAFVRMRASASMMREPPVVLA